MADRPEVPMNPQIIEEFRANGGKVGGYFQTQTDRVIPVFELQRL
ncbi:MAG TPA: hypothetical protein VLZ05_17200 [Mycobacterium sp.]|nr:hypothetical protein [Mycobacterium sp.]HUH70437.1 hypothetical protein [Mycobacterium sp.]